MDFIHKECLRTNHVYLLEFLEPDEVLNHLFRDGILNFDRMSRLKLEKIRRDQVRALLSKLPRCGPNAFPGFKKALRKTNQEFLADELSRELNLQGLNFCF